MIVHNKNHITLVKLSEAIFYAGENNPRLHNADLNLIRKLKSNSHLLKARLRRMQNVVKQLKLKANGIVLDIGCGNTINSVLSLMGGASEVHAIGFWVN